MLQLIVSSSMLLCFQAQTHAAVIQTTCLPSFIPLTAACIIRPDFLEMARRQISSCDIKISTGSEMCMRVAVETVKLSSRQLRYCIPVPPSLPPAPLTCILILTYPPPFSVLVCLEQPPLLCLLRAAVCRLHLTASSVL